MELKYEFYINAEPGKVWDALIQPGGTKAAFFDCTLRSTFEEGASFAYVGPGAEGEETVHLYGEVLAFEPHKVFSCREHPGPAYYDNHAELESRFTFTLDAVGKCTKLTLVNDQFTPNHPSFQKAEQSWWMILSSIKTYVETGNTLDFGW
ncbi:hypothetical protein YSY43_18990 [Paenibacillus sp. YSY-4.3]